MMEHSRQRVRAYAGSDGSDTRIHRNYESYAMEREERGVGGDSNIT